MRKTKQDSEVKVIIHLEDSQHDAELIKDILAKGDLEFKLYLFSEREEFKNALISLNPDIILSAFTLKRFDGFEALDLSKKYSYDTPFIFVTGTVGEEMAVSALKSGATDFILKKNLERLLPAVNRALEEVRIARERKKLYHRLKVNEERYRTLMENLPIGVFRTSLVQPGRILQANQSVSNILGFESVEQVLQTNTENFYYDLEDRKSLTSELIKTQIIKNRLIRFKKVTGEAIWVSISAMCHIDDSGNPDWIDGIIEDVTGRIEADSKLKGYIKFFETLIDTINNPVFYKDTDGRYLGCNKTFAELILGLPREKIINKTIFELSEAIPAELAVKYQEKDMALLSNPGIQIYESLVKCADGVNRYYHFSKSTYPGPDGKVAGLVGVMMDITDRVENEKELKRINEEMDLLFNSLSSIIVGVSIKDRITHWNPYAEKIFGIKASDILGHQFCESKIKWDWTIIYEGISNAILTNNSIRVNDLKYENIEKKNGILGLTINPLIRGDDILDGFIILGKDLTEQKIIEIQLLQSNKLEAIGQLAAGVAHEINTPMQYVGDNLKFINKSFIGILNMLDIYERASKKSDNASELADILQQADEMSAKIKLPYLLEQMPKALEQSLEGVARVSGIVQSMKSFSHPGTGTKMPADINRAIENTVTVSRNEWKYDCELKLDLDPELPPVPCFESELNQVILNLIVNARDAVREAKEKNEIESGLITICSRRKDNYAVIIVEDNGTGIPEKIKQKIFDPFFTTKDVGKGTGQGLPISHSIIVEKHGGMLYFESEPGKGTSFIIKIPLKEKE